MTEEEQDALCDKLCDKLVPMIEARLSDRLYAAAGKGMFSWLIKLWQPILIALILYGLTVSSKLPETVAASLPGHH